MFWRPSPFRLPPVLKAKNLLRGRRFEDDDYLTAATEVCFGDQDAEFYHSDTEDWQTRQTKSVDLDGDYVDQNVKGDCVEKK